MFAAWLIGFAREKNLSTEITEMKVADEIERKMVKNPWNWQNPSLNCHDCCEKVTIENGITRAVMKNCVDVKPTRNKLLTVRIDVLVRMRQRTAKLLNAATTSRTENKTTATIFIFRYSSCWRSQRFSILFFFFCLNTRFNAYFRRLCVIRQQPHKELWIWLRTPNICLTAKPCRVFHSVLCCALSERTQRYF